MNNKLYNQKEVVMLITKEKALELKVRRQIYHFILKHPGLHFRELVRELLIPRATLSYHTRYLEKRGLIIAKSEGGYTRFYVTNSVGNGEKKIIHIFRRKTARRILLFLLYKMVSSISEMSRELEKDPKTIEYHLKKLRELDIIEPAEVGDEVVYTVHHNVVERSPIRNEIIYRLKDPDIVWDLLVVFKKKKLFEDDFADIIYDLINYLAPGDPPKISRSLDSIMEIMYDIFPPFFVT